MAKIKLSVIIFIIFMQLFACKDVFETSNSNEPKNKVENLSIKTEDQSEIFDVVTEETTSGKSKENWEKPAVENMEDSKIFLDEPNQMTKKYFFGNYKEIDEEYDTKTKYEPETWDKTESLKEDNNEGIYLFSIKTQREYEDGTYVEGKDYFPIERKGLVSKFQERLENRQFKNDEELIDLQNNGEVFRTMAAEEKQEKEDMIEEVGKNIDHPKKTGLKNGGRCAKTQLFALLKQAQDEHEIGGDFGFDLFNHDEDFDNPEFLYRHKRTGNMLKKDKITSNSIKMGNMLKKDKITSKSTKNKKEKDMESIVMRTYKANIMENAKLKFRNKYEDIKNLVPHNMLIRSVKDDIMENMHIRHRLCGHPRKIPISNPDNCPQLTCSSMNNLKLSWINCMFGRSRARVLSDSDTSASWESTDISSREDSTMSMAERMSRYQCVCDIGFLSYMGDCIRPIECMVHLGKLPIVDKEFERQLMMEEKEDIGEELNEGTM